MVNLSTVFELSLVARGPRALGFLWDVSAAMVCQRLKAEAAGRWILLSYLGSPEGMEALKSVEDAQFARVRGAGALVAPAGPLLARLEKARLWGFELAVLPVRPTLQDIAAAPKFFSEQLRVLRTSAEISVWFNDGGARVSGHTQRVARLCSGCLLERVTGQVEDTPPSSDLLVVAQQTGLAVFRDLVVRGSPTRALVLHACGFGILKHPLPKPGPSDPVVASRLTVGPQGPTLETMSTRPLHEWIESTPLRLWGRRFFGGFARSGDAAWSKG